ncbi:hypothetical protein D3C72_2397200 [compost metagenome]
MASHTRGRLPESLALAPSSPRMVAVNTDASDTATVSSEPIRIDWKYSLIVSSLQHGRSANAQAGPCAGSSKGKRRVPV